MLKKKNHFNPSPFIEWTKLKALIVDDHPSASTLLKSLLGNLGIHLIDIADSYEDAIRYCKSNHYQLLLIDFHLDHDLNGCELATLLRKKKLLAPDCGIIMISGDHSTEVILTTMTIEPDGFITKPITMAGLAKKVSKVCVDCAQRKSIYQAMACQDIPQAILLCKQLLREKGHNHKIEALLLDLLIEQGDWEQAKRFTQLLHSQNPTHKITITEAQIEHHDGNIAQAIAILEQLIVSAPLCLEAYDRLSNYQEENKQYYDALETAERALKFTPSVSHRALQVAQLAADLDKTDHLIEAGKTLATHLPIIDVSWIICFAEFTAIFEQHFFAQTSSKKQRQLLQQLKAIHQRAYSRLLPKQQPFLTTFGHITLARFSLAQQQSLKAKRRLMVGLSTYFYTIAKLPSVILAEVLPPLIVLGETQIIAEIYNALKLRDRFDGHSQNRINALRENTLLVNGVQALVNELAQANEALNSDMLTGHTQDALQRYDDILIRYPYCSEAHLGRLQCLYQLNRLDEHNIKQSIQAVSIMPLPEKLELWRASLFELLATRYAHPQQKNTVTSQLQRHQKYQLIASKQTENVDEHTAT
ncbi:response regulator [Photobacterium sagamiensis]|uniref:response regulator n=1 Tax=Photobacterium sagamiensis TaxID=2910241 RepID=UPI003D0ED857